MKKNNIYTDHTLIINELEKSIKIYNWDFILSFLPAGSFLVGGYIRDTILGRMSLEVDVDIVVPSNAIDIGQRISDKFKGKFIVLDIEREVVRIIFNHISIDIANRISPTIEGDLKSRDFSINAIAFSFDKNCLITPEEWNKRYDELLGIKPSNDSEGCLQDVHWSEGAFGYFPSYLLGHLISAQISNQMERDIGLIDNLIENGEYQKIIFWLKNNIHKYGRSVNSMELIRKVTNEELSPNYFINHLKSKINDFC